MAEGKRQRLSSEAQAYKEFLQEKDGGQGVGREVKSGIKDTLRKAKKIREEEGAKQEEEKKEGEEYVREFLQEHGVHESFPKLLAIYLDCEPWEAVRRLQEQKEECKKFLRAVAEYNEKMEGEKEGALAKNPERKEEGVKWVSRLLLKEVFDWNTFARTHAYNMRKDGSGGTWRGPEAHNGLGRDDVGGSIFLQTKSDLLTGEIRSRGMSDVRRFELRGDYWNMLRVVLQANPKAYGFKDLKEIDRMIEKNLTRLASIFHEDRRMGLPLHFGCIYTKNFRPLSLLFYTHLERGFSVQVPELWRAIREGFCSSAQQKSVEPQKRMRFCFEALQGL